MGSNRKNRPNVLTVMCDQLSHDVFSYMGNPAIQTPNLDRMVKEGVLFTDGICTNPLCGPSRAAMLTGCYAYDGKYLESNREPFDDSLFLQEVVTVDEALAANGYHVEYHGKWHVGNGHLDCYKGDRDVFGHKLTSYHDYLAARYQPPEGDDYRMESYTQWPYKKWPVDDILGTASSEKYNIYWKNHLGVMEIRDEDTLTAYTVRKTIDFLDSRPPEPFCVTCSILHPHLPYTPNQTYADLFEPDAMPMPKNIEACYYPPLSLQPGKAPPIPDLLAPDGSGLGQFLALYYALVKEIDDWFGKLMDALEENGYRNNTLVIFTSDHGALLGSHNMLEKFQFFEESIRIPFIMSYPDGMPSGRKPTGPATGADIAPTILDYCGVPPLPQFHGRSLRKDIEGGSPKNPWAFAERHGYSCFRSHEWKVIFDPDKVPVMVFDLAEDPKEFHNLLEESPEAVNAMVSELRGKLLREHSG